MKYERTSAIFLAVLMILSVVAMGTVGAAGTDRAADSTTSVGDVAEDVPSAADVDEQHRVDERDESTDDREASSTTEVDRELRTAEGSQDVLIVLEGDLRVGGVVDRSEAAARLQRQADAIQRPIVDELNRLQHVTVDRQFWIANMVSATVDLERGDVDSLADLDGVEGVYRNYEVDRPEPVETTDDGLQIVGADGARASETGAPAGDGLRLADHGEYTYGLEQINVPEFWDEYGTGEGSTVAIMDGGVAADHPDVNPTETAVFDDEGNLVDGADPVPDYHGTHVASTATGSNASGTHVGVAPDADLYAADIFAQGGYAATVVGAIEWAVENDADVISGSIGFGCQDPAQPLHQQVLIDPIRNANDAGTAVVSSASNAGDGCVGGYGANFDSFSIGASDDGEGIAAFSSGSLIDKDRGQPDWPPEQYPADLLPGQVWDEPAADWPRQWIKPDVSAPGVGVYGADVPGDDGYGPGDYMEISGTSMAAPHVAGAIGLLQAATDDHLDDEQIEAALAETAWKPDDWDESDARWAIAEKDSRYGLGIVDVKAAADLLTGEGTATISGNVTDADGEPIAGAEVLTDDGMVTGTDENGTYSLTVGADEGVELTADAFGYDAGTQTVTIDGEEVTADFALESTVEVDDAFGDDQPPYAEIGGEFDVSYDVANLETYTLELTGDSDVSADNVSATLDGEEIDLGDPVTYDDSYAGALNVTVNVTDAAEGDEIGLVHTLEGAGETLELTTGPSELTAELEPAFFELSDFEGDEEVVVEPGVAVSASAVVTNTGQETATKDIDYVFELPGGVVGLQPLEQATLAPGESTEVSLQVTGLEAYAAPGVVTQHGFDTAERDQWGIPYYDDSIRGDVATQAPGTLLTVGDLSAPERAEPGETVDVSATVGNVGEDAGEQTVELRFDGEVVANETVTRDAMSLEGSDDEPVTFEDVQLPGESGIFSYGVATDNESVDALIGVGVDTLDVAVIQHDEALSPSWGDVTAGMIEESSPVFDDVEVVDFEAVADEDGIDRELRWETDVFVVHHMPDSGAASAAVIDDLESDETTGVVYLDQYDPIVGAEAGGISARSEQIGDPESMDGTFGGDPGAEEPLLFQIEADHPIFDGVGEAGDVVTLTESTVRERTWFTNASGQTLARVGVQSDMNGPAVAVDPETDAVLLSSIAATRYTGQVFPATGEFVHEFSDDGLAILGNAVEFADDRALDPGTISGVVTDEVTGEGVANATVVAQSEEGTVAVTTDADGTYEISITDDWGYHAVYVDDVPGGYHPEDVVEIRPADEATVDFEVAPEDPTLEGTVVDAVTGEAIAGATVYDADPSTDFFETETDENGAFFVDVAAIDGLEHGDAVAVGVAADGYERMTMRFVELGPGANEVAFELEAADDAWWTPYVNDEDVVDTSGLRQGIDDWRNGTLTTDQLRTLIDSWRSDQPMGAESRPIVAAR